MCFAFLPCDFSTKSHIKRGRMSGSCTEDGIFVKVFESIFEYSKFMEDYEKKEAVLNLLSNSENLMISNRTNSTCFKEFIYLIGGVYNNFDKSYLSSITSTVPSNLYTTEKISLSLNNQTSLDLNDRFFSMTDLDSLIRSMKNTTENIQNVILLISFTFLCSIILFIYLAFF